MPDHHFDSDVDRQAVCLDCRGKDLEKAMEEEILNLLEKKLGPI